MKQPASSSGVIVAETFSKKVRLSLPLCTPRRLVLSRQTNLQRWRLHSCFSNKQRPGFSSPDIPLVDADAENSFDWSVLNELNADHFSVLKKWNQEVGYDNQKIKTRPNYRKANWAEFQEVVMESLTELAAKEVPLRKAELDDLVRFRSMHHHNLRRWLHLPTKTESDLCRLCKEEVESAEHLWFR